jgi:hypothetical protein
LTILMLPCSHVCLTVRPPRISEVIHGRRLYRETADRLERPILLGGLVVGEALAPGRRVAGGNRLAVRTADDETARARRGGTRLRQTSAKFAQSANPRSDHRPRSRSRRRDAPASEGRVGPLLAELWKRGMRDERWFCRGRGCRPRRRIAAPLRGTRACLASGLKPASESNGETNNA